VQWIPATSKEGCDERRHRRQVYFDTNRLIRESFGRAGYPAPSHLHVVKQG
jgi:hypothetical protein